jgi:hypothetical protein
MVTVQEREAYYIHDVSMRSQDFGAYLYSRMIRVGIWFVRRMVSESEEIRKVSNEKTTAIPRG